MLVSKVLAVFLPVLALAAPSAERGTLETGDIDDLFRIEGEVLIGPGGYMKEGEFHAGEYTPDAVKRDDTHTHEPRLFGLTSLLLLKKFKGGLGGGGGGSICGSCLQGQSVGVHPHYLFGTGASGSWVWGAGGYRPGYPCGTNVCK